MYPSPRLVPTRYDTVRLSHPLSVSYSPILSTSTKYTCLTRAGIWLSDHVSILYPYTLLHPPKLTLQTKTPALKNASAFLLL